MAIRLVDATFWDDLSSRIRPNDWRRIKRAHPDILETYGAAWPDEMLRLLDERMALVGELQDELGT